MSAIGAIWERWGVVSQSIIDAFPGEQPPAGFEVVRMTKGRDAAGSPIEYRHGDAEPAHRVFAGKAWPSVVPALLCPQDYSSFAFWLTPSAKAFHLPAFLLVSTFESGNTDRHDLSGFILECLVPPARDDIAEIVGNELTHLPIRQREDDFSEFVAAFSARQKHVIADYLEFRALAGEHYRPSPEFDGALRELSSIWADFATA